MAVVTKTFDPSIIEMVKGAMSDLFDEKLACINELRTENALLKKRVAELEAEVEEGQEYTRRNNVIAYGVSLTQFESNPIQVAIEIAAKFNYKITPDDIDAAHRLGLERKANQEKDKPPPPFIIRFVHRHKKVELIRRARDTNKKENASASNSSTSNQAKKKKQIVLRDQLTKRSQVIFSYARRLWAEYYVWTWKGAVFCRHDGSDNIIPLRSIADIEMLEKDLAA